MNLNHANKQSFHILLNPFPTHAPFLYPSKTFEHRMCSDVFRGHRSGKLVNNGWNLLKSSYLLGACIANFVCYCSYYFNWNKMSTNKCSSLYLAGNYKFKVNNRSTRARCELCSKLTIKTTPERHYWRRSGVFIVNFEYIPYDVPVFLLLTLSR